MISSLARPYRYKVQMKENDYNNNHQRKNVGEEYVQALLKDNFFLKKG